MQTCYAVVISALKACSFLVACSFRRPLAFSLCPCSAMAQRTGDVHRAPAVREINSFQEASFGTGPSGDVPPPGPGPAVPRPRSTATRGRHDRRSSTAAPHPWRGNHPSASEEDCRRVDGARRALRYLFDVTQDQLEQALCEELSNAQLCYLSHCMASMWEDSGDESSRASSLETPDLAEHEHRTGRTRREPSSRGGQNRNNADPGRAQPQQPHQPASGSNDPAPPAARGAGTSWADAQDDGDVPQQPPAGQADAASSSESEPGRAAPGLRRWGSYPQVAGAVRSYRQHLEVAHRPLRRPVAGVPRADIVSVPCSQHGSGHVAPFAHMAVLCQSQASCEKEVPCTGMWQR